MLRASVLRFIRIPNHDKIYRSISINAVNRDSVGDMKPSRQLYDMLTEKNYIDELLSKSGRKPFEATVEYPIIIKKFFLAEVEKDQMLYPEVVSQASYEKLKAIEKHVDGYFRQNIEFDGKGYTDSVHNSFKQMNLYGYNIPKGFGGMGYSLSEQILASEAEGRNVDVAMSLSSHRFVCEVINQYGTDEQRAKYLPLLAKGDLVATIAFDEWNVGDLKSVNTTAELEDEDEEWSINGKLCLFRKHSRNSILF